MELSIGFGLDVVEPYRTVAGLLRRQGFDDKAADLDGFVHSLEFVEVC